MLQIPASITFILGAMPANAALNKYLVDLSGPDMYPGGTGLSLTFSGTIILDPTLPIGMAIRSSNLQMHQDGNAPQLLLSLPRYTGDTGSALSWETQGDDLYLTRIGNDLGVMEWFPVADNEAESSLSIAQFGNGFFTHNLIQSLTGVGTASTTLKPASGPDGPFGFRFGSGGVVVVPEPTSAFFLAGLAATGTMRRRKRTTV